MLLHMYVMLFNTDRLIVLDPLLCDVLRNKGNPPDEKLTWQEANQRYHPLHSKLQFKIYIRMLKYIRSCSV